MKKLHRKMGKVRLGGGCFWCLEAVFQKVAGVVRVTSGYEGGHVANPTYDDICTGSSGHAEVVEIEYDESKVSFEQLLEVFWRIHDPTTLNRQGNDVGTQYRSVIFFENNEQKLVAEASIKSLEESALYTNQVVTELKPCEQFYPAEEYHQNYYNNNSSQSYCHYVIKPKLDKMGFDH